MSAADILQGLGAALVSLSICCAIWAGRCTRPLDLAGVTFGFAGAMVAAMVALRLAHVGQGLALYFSIVLLLALGASPGGARGAPFPLDLRGPQALVLSGVGLMVALLVMAGPIVRAPPPGAVRTRRALLESDIAEGMQAALLTFHAGWLLAALAALGVGALCVMALLAEPPGSMDSGAPP